MKKWHVVLLFIATFLLICGPVSAKECQKKKIQETIENVERTAGCAAFGAAFGAACEAGTFGLGTPGCIVGAIVLDCSCEFMGKDYVHKQAGALAGDICDIGTQADKMPYIVVQNKLKNHKIDFQVEISGGDNVHMRGDNWLKPGLTGVLASTKLDGNSYEVKARIKKDGKPDTHLEIEHVKPGVHAVYVEYKNGKYSIHKKELKK